METQQTYANMLGMAEAGAPPPSVQQGMEGLMDPAASAAMAQIQRPAQSPAELEARKTGWQQVIQKLQDPNLLRSLGFAGAAMAQPGGTLGHGLATGMTAFQAGESAQQQQEIQQRLMGMREQEHEVGLEATRASTEGTRAGTAVRKAQLPGIQAESKVSQETANAKIEAARLTVQNAKFQLEKDQSEESVAKVEREVRRQRAEIIRSLPPGTVQKNILAELDRAAAEVESKRAAAAENRAQASRYQAELKGLKDLPPEKLREYFTRTGEFAPAAGGGVGSARLAQDEAVWRRVYQGLAKNTPNDPQIKGVTEDQFVRDRLVKTEDRDTMNALIRALPYMEVGSPEEARAKEMLGGMLTRRDRPDPNAPAAPTAGGGKVGPWQPIPGSPGMHYRVMPDGTRQVIRANREFEGSSNMPE